MRLIIIIKHVTVPEDFINKIVKDHDCVHRTIQSMRLMIILSNVMCHVMCHVITIQQYQQT